VEEQRQRMLGAREHTDQSPKSRLDASLRVRGREVRDGQLLSDDEFEFGNQIGDERTVRVDRATNLSAPHAQLGLGLGEKLANQTLEGLRPCRVRDVALYLVELPGCE